MGRQTPKIALPLRLVYLGGVEVAATSAGQMQLFRLLSGWPPEQLRVIEAECRIASAPDRRLPGVRYQMLEPAFQRGWYFARMRIPTLFWAMMEAHAAWQARRAARLLGSFRPEAVLTIHERFSWLTAAKLARRLGVPLHLVLHDDWFRNVPMATRLQARFERVFGEVYRAAATRFCISPGMEETYAVRFGARGTVLYPTQGADTLRHESPPPALSDPTRPLDIAYAGNVFNVGYWEALRCLAAALGSVGGRLLLFGPTAADATSHGLTGENVIVRGFVRNVAEVLRAEAQAVFVPMTFDPAERTNTQLSFPSKLAEYTAAGLPLLIHGPADCSAVRWARENPGVAEIVDQPDGLAAAVDRLARDEGHLRRRLGQRALEAGRRFFSHETATEIFFNHLRRAVPDHNGLSAARERLPSMS